MERTAYPSSTITTVKLETFLAKWGRAITALVTLCAVAAIAFGLIWLFLRKDSLVFTTLGFGSCYLIGRNFWRFRSRRTSLEN